MHFTRSFAGTARTALASLALASCGATTPAALTIDSTGGSITAIGAPIGGAAIVVPPNALSSPVNITLQQGLNPTNFPQGATAEGPVVVFGPEGQSFAVPVTVTLPATGVPRVIYTRPLGGASWSPVPGAQYDAVRRVIVAQVSHFSEFVAATPGTRCTDNSECAAPQTCVDNTCSGSVGDGGTDAAEAGCAASCDGGCVDLARDTANCGTCGNACAAGQTCRVGFCMAAPADAGSPG